MRSAPALLSAAALVTTMTGASPAAAYAAPSPLPSLTRLDARYAAVQADIGRALAAARGYGDGERVRALEGFRNRTFLSFDPRGTGRAVEVLGDPATARRIAIVVPGIDNDLGNYDSAKFVGGSARNLYEQARRLSPGTRPTVVAWLGYEPPQTPGPSVLSAGRAEEGARALVSFTRELRSLNPSARLTLVCHSYGGVVCAKAAPDARASDIALVGSPGTTADRASDLSPATRVWAARSGGDWTRFVPHVRFLGWGFGRDPVSREFGALPFPAGNGTHADYFKPGGESVRSLALIMLGARVPRG
ncbi:alpha/beta hydrolase [Actinocorallia sp. B10E7]|uniref:alpha/beta hydrolase n=1 Tax=Actinocorallia sp. B10E7 TaxID=3153558 RepID=UPI00325E1892